MEFYSTKSNIVLPKTVSKKKLHDFNTRLKAIFNELLHSYDNVVFIEKLIKLANDKNGLFEISPGFLNWVYKAKFKEIILFMSRVLEKTNTRNRVIDNLVNIASME